VETVCVLTFLTAFLLVFGVVEASSAERRQVLRRMKRIAARGRGQEEPQALDSPGRSELWRRILAWAGGLALARRLGRLVDKKLEEADILLTGGEFMVLVLSAALITSSVLFTFTLNLAGSLVLGAAAAILPFVLLDAAKGRRVMSFNAQISDALTILANSLRSGFSFVQGMDMVRNELPDPIKKEFTRTMKEITLGTTTEEALENLAARVRSDDLGLIVTAVLIQRQVGGNLAEILDNIAATVRDRMRIKREIRTLTAQGRISGLIIGLLPLILGGFMLVISPNYLAELFSTQIGLVMLLLAVAGEFVGFLLIRKIVNIKF
jgi:tight adherence protein B